MGMVDLCFELQILDETSLWLNNHVATYLHSVDTDQRLLVSIVLFSVSLCHNILTLKKSCLHFSFFTSTYHFMQIALGIERVFPTLMQADCDFQRA